MEANVSLITADTCNQTLELVSSKTFLVILALEVSVAIIGVVTNILLIVAVVRSRAFHSNLRLLLVHLSLNAFAYCASSMARAIHAVVTMSSDPCQLVVSMYSCKLQELAVVLPLNNLMYSVLSIGVERLYATIRRHNYEHGSSVILSLFLVAVTWTFALGFQLSSIPNMPKTVMAPFCVNILVVSKSMAMVMLVFNISQECVGLFLYLVTYILNKFLYLQLLINKSSKHSLTVRFQMSQNIQVCRFMLPSVCVHMLCWIPANAFVASIVAGMDLQYTQKVQMVHVAYLLALIYCVVHPVLCFGVDPRMRGRVCNIFSTPKVKPTIGQGSKCLEPAARTPTAHQRPKANVEDHFNILLRTWEQIGTSEK